MSEEFWQEMYNLAKMYYEKYKHLQITRTTKVLVVDGELIIISTNDPRYNNSIPLGRWINTQRSAVNSMPKEKIDKLDEIGMLWKIKEKTNDELWQEMFELAKKYYEQFGNLKISQGLRVIIHNNELLVIREDDERYKNAIALGSWIHNQRCAYNKTGTCILTREREELLNNIGMVWSLRDFSWDDMYNLAKKYYEQYGNLKISQHLRVMLDNDNLILISRDDERFESAVQLGVWINTQRQAYKGTSVAIMTPERKILLDNIGMLWDTKVNKEKLNELLIQYGIDIKKNKSIRYKSYDEVCSKIMYLLEFGISITNEDGKLHEIFYMSDVNMKERYNVTLEELLEKYAISERTI